MPPVAASPAPAIPFTTSAPHVPLLMQLFTAPDYRLPLEPSTKVQSDKRIYAEVRTTPPYFSVTAPLKAVGLSLDGSASCVPVRVLNGGRKAWVFI